MTKLLRDKDALAGFGCNLALFGFRYCQIIGRMSFGEIKRVDHSIIRQVQRQLGRGYSLICTELKNALSTNLLNKSR